jgi:hypothetical protein
MITEEAFEFYNTRLTHDLVKLKDLTPSQQDRIRHLGSQAEALLKNKDLAMFIHQFKFTINDELASIRGHQEQDDAARLALCHTLAGIDDFVNSLKKAVYYKNKIGNTGVPNE